ncbi:Nucleolar Complex 2 protein [Tritrichomonas musculus]|uniref:Nucleolar Complex 2 protein n=1 Tax=Tritrichomonas musculus TaxID=1915356 RepID=A0ABR2IYU1_9EUKA
MSGIRDFEEEDIPEYDEENDAEEEEEVGELIVIDNELITSLKEGIESENPIQLAQAVDVIIGFLGYKTNFTAEEDLEQSPLLSLLPKLVPKLLDLHNESKEGSTKREKVDHLLETLSAGILDSFEKFKKDADLFDIYCKSIASTRKFVDEKVLKKAFIDASKLGLAKESYRNSIYPLFGELLSDETLGTTVLQMQYSELTKLNEQDAIESLLPSILNFYLDHKDEVLPYVKSLVKRLSSELIDTMEKSDKSMISWRTLATLKLISQYMIETNERRLIYPVFLILTSFLRHFPIKTYLPFQIRIANILNQLSQSFEVFEPILCWATDSIQFICSSNCKPGSKFNWDTELRSPQILTYEFCHGAIEHLKRIFFANLLSNCESIAFPEYIMPIKEHLAAIVATKTKLSFEVKFLLNQISEQSKTLVNLKRGIEWSTRQEQITQWKETIEQNSPTPLKDTLVRQSNIEEKKRKMKEEQNIKTKIDDGTGITAEVATADDV